MIEFWNTLIICKVYISNRIYAFLFSIAPLVYQPRGCIWQMPRVMMMESPICTQNRRKQQNKLGWHASWTNVNNPLLWHDVMPLCAPLAYFWFSIVPTNLDVFFLLLLFFFGDKLMFFFGDKFRVPIFLETFSNFFLETYSNFFGNILNIYQKGNTCIVEVTKNNSSERNAWNGTFSLEIDVIRVSHEDCIFKSNVQKQVTIKQ